MALPKEAKSRLSVAGTKRFAAESSPLRVFQPDWAALTQERYPPARTSIPGRAGPTRGPLVPTF
jgi:hypothetical protein